MLGLSAPRTGNTANPATMINVVICFMARPVPPAGFFAMSIRPAPPRADSFPPPGTGRPPFPVGVLAARNPPRRQVTVELPVGIIVVAVDHNRAVIAGDDEQGVLGELEAFERLDHFADAPVELLNHVAAHATA